MCESVRPDRYSIWVVGTPLTQNLKIQGPRPPTTGVRGAALIQFLARCASYFEPGRYAAE